MRTQVAWFHVSAFLVAVLHVLQKAKVGSLSGWNLRFTELRSFRGSAAKILTSFEMAFVSEDSLQWQYG